MLLLQSSHAKNVRAKLHAFLLATRPRCLKGSPGVGERAHADICQNWCGCLLRFVLQRIIGMANHGEMVLFFGGKFFKDSPPLGILDFISIMAEKLVRAPF